MILNWYKDVDANDKTIWAASSPYNDDGSPLCFRVKEASSGQFQLVGDAELMTIAHEALIFATLEEAKSFCQTQCDEIVAQIEAEVDG